MCRLFLYRKAWHPPRRQTTTQDSGRAHNFPTKKPKAFPVRCRCSASWWINPSTTPVRSDQLLVSSGSVPQKVTSFLAVPWVAFKVVQIEIFWRFISFRFHCLLFPVDVAVSLWLFRPPRSNEMTHHTPSKRQRRAPSSHRPVIMMRWRRAASVYVSGAAFEVKFLREGWEN